SCATSFRTSLSWTASSSTASMPCRWSQTRPVRARTTSKPIWAVRIGPEHVGQQFGAVLPQRRHEKLGLGTEVGIEGGVAHAGNLGDAGDPRSVVAIDGEDLGGRAEQPFPYLCRTDPGDPTHGKNLMDVHLCCKP